jgi:hypothetical protein
VETKKNKGQFMEGVFKELMSGQSTDFAEISAANFFLSLPNTASFILIDFLSFTRHISVRSLKAQAMHISL